ncbi:MAG: CHAP domain-containing protein [Ruminococcaceae bacterium]|nr:CHAP domain-containing protein [Oscillospiraceae bacterium]
MRCFVMKNLLIRLFAVMLCASMALVSVGAVEPCYEVSQEYKDGGYYDRLLAYELTGDPRYDVLSIALTQLGYHEGDSDADMDGLNIDGDRNFVEYNRLYGKVDNKEGNGVSYGYAWCASFVTWCLRQAGVGYTQAINSISCSGMTDWYIRNKIFHFSEEGYIPLPGDIIMFSPNDDPSHVGLVLGVLEDKVYTVEGNNGGIVGIHSYDLTDDYILGYCVPKYGESDTVMDCEPLLTGNINKTGEFIVNAKSLNVRSDASNDSEVLGTLSKHDSVIVSERNGNWGKIEFEGAEGWIYMPHTTDADYMVYSLKYELGGGEGIEHQRKLKGGKFAVTDEIPARKGYDFIGWTDDKDSKEPNVKAGDVYSEDADITLYAIWKEAKYTVTFYDEDGTVLHSEECDFNAWVPTVEEPTKESDGEYKYVFAGWTPELVQVVVKDLEYTATYEKIALTEEEKAQLNASAESEEKAASDDKDGGIPSYVYIIIGVLLVVAGVLIVFKNKIFSKKAND